MQVDYWFNFLSTTQFYQKSSRMSASRLRFDFWVGVVHCYYYLYLWLYQYFIFVASVVLSSFFNRSFLLLFFPINFLHLSLNSFVLSTLPTIRSSFSTIWFFQIFIHESHSIFWLLSNITFFHLFQFSIVSFLILYFC